MRNLFLLTAFAVSCLSTQAVTLEKNYKEVGHANPLSPCVFCADPTAIDYNGRIYVYGTNDHQQFIKNGKSGSNGYGNIKSLVVFSSADMVNWTFHGTIDVGKVCGSWCGQSWAPSAVWRTNANGKDEFFIYFANGGGSVGVIKSTTSPVGPFNSPRSSALIQHGMPGVDPCNWVFDPGVVIDGEGTGWIAFGGGDPQSTGSKLMPGNSRIAKLKPSMTAMDGSAVNLPAPYLFEASELNIMDGRFVYTYNTSWSDRNDWSSYAKRNGQPAPSSCSMCYMVTDTPLDPDSWEYRGEYVPNEGNFGMGWGNNHTHLHKFQGSYYLFYHSTLLEQSMNTGASGFRSIGINKVTVDESTQKISKVTMTKNGVSAIASLNPYEEQQFETMATSGGVDYQDFSNISKPTNVSTLGNDASRNLQVKMKAGAWIMVRKVDFGTTGASRFIVRAKGTGTLEVRLDNKTKAAAATVPLASTGYEEYSVVVDPAVFNGTHNVYLVVTESTNVTADSWYFTDASTDGIEDVKMPSSNDRTAHQRSQQGYNAQFSLSGHRVTTPRRGLVVERRANGKNAVILRKK